MNATAAGANWILALLVSVVLHVVVVGAWLTLGRSDTEKLETPEAKAAAESGSAKPSEENKAPGTEVSSQGAEFPDARAEADRRAVEGALAEESPVSTPKTERAKATEETRPRDVPSESKPKKQSAKKNPHARDNKKAEAGDSSGILNAAAARARDLAESGDASSLPLDDLKPSQRITPTETVERAKPAKDKPVRTVTYVVKPGDNLTRLAREAGMTQGELAQLNKVPLRKLANLRVGQKIKLPAKSKEP